VRSVRFRPQLTGSIVTHLFLPPPQLRLAFLSGSDSFVFELSKEPAILVFLRTGGRCTGGLRLAQ